MINHLSASAIRDYSNCEALSAYRRHFEGVPKIPLGIYFAFGIVVHKINEMMARFFWNYVCVNRRPVDRGKLKKWLGFARVYLMNVMDEKWGARGKDEEIIPLSWMTLGRKSSLSPAEYQLEIQRKKDE